MQRPMASIESGIPTEAACIQHLSQRFELIPQYHGSTVHHVQSDERDQAGFNSKHSGVIGFHNDAYDYPEVPTHLALYCIEAESTGCQTFYASYETALACLSYDECQLLLGRKFEFHTDPARYYQTPGVGVHARILENGVLRFSAGYLRSKLADSTLLAIIDRFEQALHGARQDALLAPGDLLIMDNQSLLHGRTAFAGRRKLARFWMKPREPSNDSGGLK